MTSLAAKVWADAMADPAFVEGMRQGMADFEAGRTFAFSDIKEGRCGANLGDGTWCQEPTGHMEHWPDAGDLGA